MRIGQKVLVEVEIVQIVADVNGIHYRVALDAKYPLFGSLEVTDRDIRFQEVR
ncbi:MAG: hypothetical protein RBU23_13200 [Candidatus Auribacterota bacterium]|jgi:hypothetical protein|nr:hypothetical protein [Candidatus Auribacterota bacterium]